MPNNIGIPECRMCGRRCPAGRYSVVTDVGGTRHKVSEYVCDRCWKLLKRGGTKGHLFQATGQRWWLSQYLEPLG